MQTSTASHARSQPMSRLAKVVQFVAVCALSFGLAWLKWQPGSRVPQAQATPAPLAQVVPYDADGAKARRMQEGELRFRKSVEAFTQPPAAR